MKRHSSGIKWRQGQKICASTAKLYSKHTPRRCLDSCNHVMGTWLQNWQEVKRRCRTEEFLRKCRVPSFSLDAFILESLALNVQWITRQITMPCITKEPLCPQVGIGIIVFPAFNLFLAGQQLSNNSS